MAPSTRSGQRPGDDVVQFGSPREPRRPRWPWPGMLGRRPWLLVPLGAVAAAIAVAVMAGGHHHHHGRSPVRVTMAGHPVLGVRGGWQLLGLGPGALVRIQLAAGRVTTTTVPALASGGPVFFLADRAEAVIRPLDFVPGYRVPAGRSARALPALLSHGGVLLPGPRPGQGWVQVGQGNHQTMSLIWLDGRATGVSVRISGGGFMFPSADGAGYPLLTSTVTSYDARPGSARLVPGGRVVAVGPTGWLTVTCDRGRCTESVVDRATWARRVISRSPRDRADVPIGVISPDGSTAAVFRMEAPRVYVYLVDLRSGAARRLPVDISPGLAGSGSAAWSPGGRWLFVAARGGRVLAVDARTGMVHPLGVALPAITQLTVVPARADG